MVCRWGRESYAKALAFNAWQGFSCYLTTYDRDSFEEALASSGATLLTTIRGVSAWSSQLCHGPRTSGVMAMGLMHVGMTGSLARMNSAMPSNQSLQPTATTVTPFAFCKRCTGSVGRLAHALVDAQRAHFKWPSESDQRKARKTLA